MCPIHEIIFNKPLVDPTDQEICIQIKTGSTEVIYHGMHDPRPILPSMTLIFQSGEQGEIVIVPTPDSLPDPLIKHAGENGNGLAEAVKKITNVCLGPSNKKIYLVEETKGRHRTVIGEIFWAEH
jgi:hypothetical protein